MTDLTVKFSDDQAVAFDSVSALLRQAGVDLGKRDYLGGLNLQ